MEWNGMEWNGMKEKPRNVKFIKNCRDSRELGSGK
jgi:hypothetical protein